MLNVLPGLEELSSIFHLCKQEEMEKGGRLHLYFPCKNSEFTVNPEQ